MKTGLILNKDTMGHGNEELGERLIGAFLRKIWARQEQLNYILVYNAGVNLLGSESSCLEVLTGLEKSGVEILACGTCLDFYELSDDIKVGRRSDMEEIVDCMMAVDKLINI